jgi:lysozyme
MVSRRAVLAAMTALPAMAGCSGRQAAGPSPNVSYAPSRGAPNGLDAVIDISHNVQVSDFNLIRQSNILGVIHKASEGGDWFDPSYGARRRQAESAGLLWGGYHFGTRQYSGEQQAAAFLSITQPGPRTLMALDLEPNDANPRNTMRFAQAEAFVLAIHRATGRLPVVYTHCRWANGERYGRAGTTLDVPITSASVVARCDLWLADYREEPEVPVAWSDRGWRLWQYVANESESDAAYGTVSRAVKGVGHCDRNLFAGDAAALSRFWSGRG